MLQESGHWSVGGKTQARCQRAFVCTYACICVEVGAFLWVSVKQVVDWFSFTACFLRDNETVKVPGILCSKLGARPVNGLQVVIKGNEADLLFVSCLLCGAGKGLSET